MVNTEFIRSIIYHILIGIYSYYKLLFLREILLLTVFKFLNFFSPSKEGAFFCLFVLLSTNCRIMGL